jgi:hypothetical protein
VGRDGVGPRADQRGPHWDAGAWRTAVVRDGQFVGMFTIDDAPVGMARDLGDLARPITAELMFAHRVPPVQVAVSS